MVAHFAVGWKAIGVGWAAMATYQYRRALEIDVNSNYYSPYLIHGLLALENEEERSQYVTEVDALKVRPDFTKRLSRIEQRILLSLREFYDGDGKQPFSFITNQRWLLFYFRKPAIRSKKYSAEKLAKLFDSLNQTSAGEWTIKIKNVDDAHRIAGFLGWLAK